MIENIIKFDNINIELNKKYVYQLMKEHGDNSIFIIYVSFFGQEPSYHILSVHENCGGVTAIIDNHEFYYNFIVGAKVMPIIKGICKINYENS